MSQIYAQPLFNLDGRLIDSYEDFQEYCQDLQITPEFQFSFVAGTKEDLQLFNVCQRGSNCLRLWMEVIEPLDSHEKAALFYLVDACHYNAELALEKMHDTCVQEGTLLEVATALFDEIYLHKLPEAIQSSVDYEKLAYNMRVGGGMYEFTFGGKSYTCTNPHDH